MEKFTVYWKSVVAAVAPVYYSVQSAVDDGVITGEEWANIAVLSAVAITVYLKANTVNGENVATTTAHVVNK